MKANKSLNRMAYSHRLALSLAAIASMGQKPNHNGGCSEQSELEQPFL
jgi:hypothetical protein